MSILSSLFGKRVNPMDAASQYADQIPGEAHKGYDPYINQGREASEKTNGMYDKLMDDPQAFIDSLMKNYQTSDAYKYQSKKQND